MSETPRVDAAAERGSDLGMANEWASGIWTLARTLERELAAVTRERDLFRDALDCLARLGNEPLLGNSRGNQIAQDALGGRYIAEVEEEQRKRNAERDALRAEVERLTACLKRANAQAEEFERKWYLRGDEVERLRGAIKGQASLLPLLPTAPAGSYARGYDSGMRDTITAISAALTPAEEPKT